ncbi:enoyl-CoA hydratase-related protein [Arthrobacter sp. CC3]|uniref:enoyl-CoA hydratase-related protein n=1 Tax=Arthrobacter sp. CC3 TaxID=3029185 RepID=UPI003266C020
MQEYSNIILERVGHIAWITLNRPERLNAMNGALLAEFSHALDVLAASNNRVVVIKGAGRSFSAGYDIAADSDEIGYTAERGPVEDRDHLLYNIDLWTKIWRHPQPVIAAVHGVCVAGATQLASMCDITIVTDDATIMASPALPLGGGYISPLWSHLVGPKRAKLMSFDAGRRISGKTAAAWGWATESVPAEEFENHVRETAQSIARTPASLLKVKKEAINRTIELQGLLTYARMGAETDALLHLTPEVVQIQNLIKTHGLKEAIRLFNAGALEFDEAIQ